MAFRAIYFTHPMLSPSRGLNRTFMFIFSGEYHGFAKAESKQTALDGEFYFFSKLLKFEAADKGIEVSFTDYVLL